MIRSMKNTRVSVVAAGAAVALTATVLTIAPTAGAGAASSAPTFSASGGIEASALAMARRKTKLKVKTTGDKVLVNTKASVYGKVNGPKRKVVLELKNAYGWRTIDKDKSNKKGKYELKAPTKWYGKKKMRVVVPPTRAFQGKVKGTAIKIDEGYEPLGSKKSWTRISSAKTRYNPCKPIKYAVNPNMLPADGVAVLNEAIFRIEMASGLRYKYDGSTNAIPFRTTPGKKSDKLANLSVAWSSPDTDAANLGGLVLARGGFNGTKYVPRRKTYQLTKTGLLMDASDTYEDRGFVNGAGLGAVHMHELVHAAGLGHTNDPTQIMYPVVDASRPPLYGKGDITGLQKHGQDAGCLSRSGNARVVPGVAVSLPETSVPFVRGEEH